MSRPRVHMYRLYLATMIFLATTTLFRFHMYRFHFTLLTTTASLLINMKFPIFLIVVCR